MIKIYQTTTCPFCIMVVQEARRLGLQPGRDYELVHAPRGSRGREEMLSIGGRNQVPFLTDGELSMYKSADIIQYMRAKFAGAQEFHRENS